MKLNTFDFQEAPVRAFLGENGEPWFVANDVCGVLELGNPRQAVATLDPEEKGVITTDTLGGAQKLNLVSEAGLYCLIFRSRKPEARAFKRWVTKEVLPAIRKTGGYQAPGLQLSEEDEVQSVARELRVAISAKIAGRMTNGDAAVLVNLASQYLRSWDVRLRLRGARVPEIAAVKVSALETGEEVAA